MSRGDIAKIAQRFNAGYGAADGGAPDGPKETVRRCNEASAVPDGTRGVPCHNPSVETLGYSCPFPRRNDAEGAAGARNLFRRSVHFPRTFTPFPMSLGPNTISCVRTTFRNTQKPIGQSAFLRNKFRTRAPVRALTWRGESPRQAEVHRSVTEGYCVVATRGGELPEVNRQSVTRSHENETT